MSVILYSTHCPRCVVLENMLKEKNINYQIVTDENEILAKGFTVVPVLQVNDTIMSMKEAMEWIGVK